MKTKLLAAACLAATVAFTTYSAAQTLGVAAGRQGSQNYGANAGMAKFLADELGMDVRLQSYGGSGQSMPLIDAGRLDIQLVPSPDFSAAVLGQGPFEGRELQNLRVLTTMSSSAYGFMVRKDSEYENVSDIQGLSITYGFTAQPTLRLQVDAILAAGGLSIDDMEMDNVPSVPNGVDNFIQGKTDVAFFALQGGKTREADAAVGIRWLAVPNTPEAQAAMQEFVPTSFIKVVEPGAAPGIDVTTPMMGYDYVMTAGAHVPDEVVTDILQHLYDNPDKVRGIFKTMSGFNKAGMAPDLKGLTYHPAAVAFYESIGLMD